VEATLRAREKFSFYLSLDRSFRLTQKKKIMNAEKGIGGLTLTFNTNSLSLLFMQAKPANAAMLQLIVGFLVGAVFVSIFSGGGSNYSVRSSFSLYYSLCDEQVCLFVCALFCPLSLVLERAFE
jgi:hypothetical protein